MSDALDAHPDAAWFFAEVLDDDLERTRDELWRSGRWDDPDVLEAVAAIGHQLHLKEIALRSAIWASAPTRRLPRRMPRARSRRPRRRRTTRASARDGPDPGDPEPDPAGDRAGDSPSPRIAP